MPRRLLPKPLAAIHEIGEPALAVVDAHIGRRAVAVGPLIGHQREIAWQRLDAEYVVHDVALVGIGGQVQHLVEQRHGLLVEVEHEGRIVARVDVLSVDAVGQHNATCSLDAQFL